MDRLHLDPRRAGIMLTELLVTLVILGLVGAATTGLFLSQSRLFGQQDAMREARTTSQGALNILMSELRMVDAATGVVAASPASITLRVPYALGVVCSGDATATFVTLFPVDNTTVTDAELEGYAWRDTDGAYQYRSGSLAAGGASECAGAGINTVPGGRTAKLEPGDPSVHSAAPVLLYRRITYEFKTSAGSPGGVDLWRTVAGATADEAISGPFDGATTGFRFFVHGEEEPESSPPSNLSTIEGLELILNGLSDRPGATGSAYRAEFATAVFFHNR